MAEIQTAADQRIGDSLACWILRLAKVAELRGYVRPMLLHTANLAAQVDNAAPLFPGLRLQLGCVRRRN